MYCQFCGAKLKREVREIIQYIPSEIAHRCPRSGKDVKYWAHGNEVPSYHFTVGSTNHSDLDLITKDLRRLYHKYLKSYE